MEKKNYEEIFKYCKKDLELIMSISFVASNATCIKDFEIMVLFKELFELSSNVFSLLDEIY